MGIKLFFVDLLSSAQVPGFKGWTAVPQVASERYPTTEEFLERNAKEYLSVPSTQSLDLGCGSIPRNPFNATSSLGVDINPSEDGRVVYCDLGITPIPFKDGCFDFVTASDVIEHIQRVATIDGGTKYPFIQLMNDIHRVLKPGGLFLSRTPAYPEKEAFQDPTHVNIITEDTFPIYFCNGYLARMYGFYGEFALIAQEWCRPSLLTLLKKIGSNDSSPHPNQ